jgi:uncharacterized protein
MGTGFSGRRLPAWCRMKFLADRMLGKLARELRMIGYDTLYYRGNDPHELMDMARQQGRTVLTRSPGHIPHRAEDPVVVVTEDDPLLQLKDLVRAGYVSLRREDAFSRCVVCNGFIHRVSRPEVEGHVPDFIFRNHEEFFQCPECHRIYWKGSHQERMQKRIDDLFGLHEPPM